MFDRRNSSLRYVIAFCVLCLAVPIATSAELTDRIDASNDVARLMDPGASVLEEIVARVGLRPVRVNTRVLPRTIARRTNLCENRRRTGYPQPSANSSQDSYGDCVWAAIDGVPWEGVHEWCNDHRTPSVPWYQVTFESPVELGELHLYLRREYPLRDFDVLTRPREEGQWKTLTQVRGNTESIHEFLFPTQTVSSIRVLCHRGPNRQPSIRRILELMAFSPVLPQPEEPAGMSYRIAVPRGRPFHVIVREAFREGEALADVAYDVLVNGRMAHSRRHRCDGPGAISYWFAADAVGADSAELRFVDTSGQGLALAGVTVVEDPIAYARQRGLLRPMIVAPRIPIRPPFEAPVFERQLAAWVETLGPASEFIQPGLLAITGYAARKEATVAQRIEAYAALCEKLNVPWVLQLSSWWADTPLRVPDALGGTFGDLRYQQIGYSRFDTYHDPGLEQFMESVAPGSYDVRYGLTTPNLWSNTPWLTMNNDRLNAFKTQRVKSAIAVVNGLSNRRSGELLRALVTDDEPMYWPRITDWMPGGYHEVNDGVRRSDLILDFNPAVVEDAIKDGVELDPRDGLDDTERAWLHENNARHVAMICKAIQDTLPKDSRLREHIFNYVLASPQYPLDDYAHPTFELGVVPGAAIGLEAFDERYFQRARELGPLANSDFECGRPTPEKIASWEPRFRAWYDVGCEFVQLCNPGPGQNWGELAAAMAQWDTDERLTARALSAIIQEAAIQRWRHAEFGDLAPHAIRPLLDSAVPVEQDK